MEIYRLPFDLLCIVWKQAVEGGVYRTLPKFFSFFFGFDGLLANKNPIKSKKVGIKINIHINPFPNKKTRKELLKKL